MPRWVWPLPVAVAALLPWTAPLPLRAPTIDLAIGENASYFLAIGVLLLLGLCLAAKDAWAGALAIYLILRAIWTPYPAAYDSAQAIAFGGMLLLAARLVPHQWRTWAGHVLCVTAILQVAYAVFQEYQYTPLWMGWQQIPGPLKWIHGTLGNPNHLGAYLAMTAALAPWWALPVWAAGLIMAQSALAGLAAGVALMLRFREHWRLSLPAAAVLLLLVFASRGVATGSWQDRLTIWRVAAQTVLHVSPGVGYGTGSWQTLGPFFQRNPAVASKLHTPEAWESAHNEPVQLLFEGGLVALILLGGWLAAHWRLVLVGRFGAAAAAGGIICLASFPFHVPTLAVLLLTVTGIAIQEHEEASECPLRY